jgi:hypothetical protein
METVNYILSFTDIKNLGKKIFLTEEKDTKQRSR